MEAEAKPGQRESLRKEWVPQQEAQMQVVEGIGPP
jgi:hypothetical protein